MLLEKQFDQIADQAYRASLVAASSAHDGELLWMLLEVDRLGFFDWGWALAVLASLAGSWKPRLHLIICAAVFGLSCLVSLKSQGEGDGFTNGVLTYCLLVGLTTLVVWAIPLKILLLLLGGMTANKVLPNRDRAPQRFYPNDLLQPGSWFVVPCFRKVSGRRGSILTR